MNLTPTEVRLIVAFLEELSDRMGNSGCNDYRLIKDGGMESEEERKELLTKMAAWNGDELELEDMKTKTDWDHTSDFYLVAYLAARLKESADNSDVDVRADTIPAS